MAMPEKLTRELLTRLKSDLREEGDVAPTSVQPLVELLTAFLCWSPDAAYTIGPRGLEVESVDLGWLGCGR